MLKLYHVCCTWNMVKFNMFKALETDGVQHAQCGTYLLYACTYTVNSLMINVCVFETKPCSRGLIFAVISVLVNYLATHELCLQVFIYFFL